MKTLNARVDSDLSWEIDTVPTCWNLDLGLFDQLPKSIHDAMQFQTLELAIDHFYDTLWRRHQGLVTLYRGPAVPNIRWDDSLEQHFDSWKHKHSDSLPLFLFDVGSRYLRLLADALPEEVPLALALDFTGIDCPILRARLSLYERFKMPSPPPAQTAVCLPDKAIITPEMQAALPTDRPFRFIAENRLTLDWNELDEIILFPEHMQTHSMRKLQGFSAAGGVLTVV